MNKAYIYHKPSDIDIEKMNELRQAFSDLHNLIEELVPKSRERAVALTHLETSAMWANKSILHSAGT